MSMGKGGAPSAPKPPPFKPIDLNQAQDLFTKYQTLGFNLSDADLAKRYPGLVQQRATNIRQDYNALTGKIDPNVEAGFTESALARNFGAFGGPRANIGGAGSAARGAIAADVARQGSTYEDLSRQNLIQDLQDNPERALTLSGDDLVSLAIGNLTGENQAAYQAYAGQVAGANAAGAAGAQETTAGIGTVISILGLVLA